MIIFSKNNMPRVVFLAFSFLFVATSLVMAADVNEEAGVPKETLLQRARRCVVEVPDDPANVRVLGVLGGKRDISVLEALGTAGWHAEDVAEALAFMEHRSAREALVRVACRADAWEPAVRALMRAPRAEEVDLYLEALERDSRAASAVGQAVRTALEAN